MNVIDLSNNEFKRFSQFGEDGITLEILRNIGDSNRFYVEFGAYPNECNSKILKVDWGWNGIAFDREASYHELDSSIFTEEITPININDTFRKYGVPQHPDFMSIDVDGLDFHIWHQMSSEFDPNIMCIEVNTHHLWNEDKVVPLAERFNWDYSDYFGASLMAMNKLAESRGYVLVYVTSEGVNAFFVKKSSILSGIEFFNQGNVERLYRSIRNPPVGGHAPDRQNRPYHESRRYLEIQKIENVLTVYHIDSPKLRLGPDYDGGYIVNQLLLNNSDRLISLGIGPSDAFESDWYAKTNKPVELYDGESLPGGAERIAEGFYVQRNIGIKNTEIPFDVLLVGKKNVLLKIDIEGGEYTIFSDVCLANVTGLILEVHSLEDGERKEDFIDILLSKILPQFYLFHIHANNCDTGVLELSFINKNLVLTAPNKETETFPISELDFPNNPNIPDIILDWINK